jgi:hypothetical protein
MLLQKKTAAIDLEQKNFHTNLSFQRSDQFQLRRHYGSIFCSEICFAAYCLSISWERCSAKYPYSYSYSKFASLEHQNLLALYSEFFLY